MSTKPPIIDLVSYAAVEERRPDVHAAGYAIPMTASAAVKLAHLLSSHPVEAGAKLFGPADRDFIDLVEFDERGSARSSSTVYRPDATWGQARVDYHLSQPEEQMRLWAGDAHSHPGDHGFPSGAAGPNRGDLAMARAALAGAAWMARYQMIIATRGQGRDTLDDPQVIRLWGWSVERARCEEALFAPVVVCHEADAPPRSFAPAWLDAVAALATTSASTSPSSGSATTGSTPIEIARSVMGARDVAFVVQGDQLHAVALSDHMQLTMRPATQTTPATATITFPTALLAARDRADQTQTPEDIHDRS